MCPIRSRVSTVFSFRLIGWLVHFRIDGLMVRNLLLEIAVHSDCQLSRILALMKFLTSVKGMGMLVVGRFVEFFAAASAFSLPSIPTWDGDQIKMTSLFCVHWISKRAFNISVFMEFVDDDILMTIRSQSK